MRKILVMALFFSSSCFADDITKIWTKLESDYVIAVQQQDYKKALEYALELNKIDPNDTQVLLFIVFASVKSQTELPNWVMEKPWGSASTLDVFNKQLAIQLLNGS
ncbi:hypothetical protein L1077_26920 [Pseudoalteromonas luteoviolacea]|uniref:hypothetical protein n=1 Tax=Pseudoalteromonas luteoviolacea TaxID=43657 RepID=UPI001F3FDA4A|nr:hypothetical protein [Pseudoalteromonas luteoviolacea]MCF6443063.1 hypothetical protein [Pseudoalteromonas luteoviolacea]